MAGARQFLNKIRTFWNYILETFYKSSSGEFKCFPLLPLRGMWKRVKECKRRLECNRPLSPSLSPTNWGKRKKQIPLCLPLEKGEIKK